MKPTEAEVLSYARRVMAEFPNTSPNQLSAILKAKFAADKGFLEAVKIGAVSNPVDWVRGLAAILAGISRLWTARDPEGIQDIINGVVIIVSEEQAP